MAFWCIRASVPGLGLYGNRSPVLNQEDAENYCLHPSPTPLPPNLQIPHPGDNPILNSCPVLRTNFGFGLLNQCLRMDEVLPLKKKKQKTSIGFYLT